MTSGKLTIIKPFIRLQSIRPSRKAITAPMRPIIGQTNNVLQPTGFNGPNHAARINRDKTEIEIPAIKKYGLMVL